ncbi:MAG TPA: nitroreductase family protein [Candidatus Desulfovibrio gallistercoris]|nr:nitroreductase family protein [Candidatus Desulfovibrio gallistercoris]
MEFFEALRTRRSIRKYTAEPVAQEDVRVMLEAAMLAPSASNRQPWHFVVVDDRATLDRIAAEHPYAKMAADAPLAIVVCGDLDAEKTKGFWVQDCSAATQNLMLAGRALGIGSVWCGLHPVEDRVAPIRRILGLPDNIIPLSLVVMGHPAQDFSEADRYQEAKVHHNHW